MEGLVTHAATLQGMSALPTELDLGRPVAQQTEHGLQSARSALAAGHPARPQRSKRVTWARWNFSGAGGKQGGGPGDLGPRTTK